MMIKTQVTRVWEKANLANHDGQPLELWVLRLQRRDVLFNVRLES